MALLPLANHSQFPKFRFDHSVLQSLYREAAYPERPRTRAHSTFSRFLSASPR